MRSVPFSCPVVVCVRDEGARVDTSTHEEKVEQIEK